ncbi:PUA-like domain-containing protein, partial [Schizophyllum commune]
MSPKYWLLKAEPDSRVVKGKDVKFSVDDFEAVKTSPWEGVRNYEARNLLREMKVGDKVLFYHSNCKNPGIAGFAEISKEAYPDYTAWDPDHPYYDPKSNKDLPKWYMPDVTFIARAAHLVPLSLLRTIASARSAEAAGVSYIGKEGVEAIKGMALITRGRLSVQRVEESAWNTIQAMAEKGGWEKQVATRKLAQAKKVGGAKGGARKKAAKDEEDDDDDGKDED